ncbi:MAG: hypothetical protein LH470_07040 [Lysobacter sp.]|nr:hypothetical protein [Lysobacter sp.]
MVEGFPLSFVYPMLCDGAEFAWPWVNSRLVPTRPKLGKCLKNGTRGGYTCLMLAVCGFAVASEVTLENEYNRRLQVYQTVQPPGDTPFGEQLNPYTGDLTFSQTDVVLEGLGPTIRLVRDLQSFQNSDASLVPPAFGDWNLSIPRIQTLTDAPTGTTPITTPGMNWVVSYKTDPNRFARCTRFNRPNYFGTLDDPEAGWNGMTLLTEDGVQQTILKRSTQNTLQPALLDAGGNPIPFPAVTLQNWQIGCLPATSNGEAGEAFLVVSPEGTKYRFDYLIGERALTIKQMDPYGSPMWLKQRRMLAKMYVSRIEDRFGNWVQYNYSGAKLSSITSKDDRTIILTWRSDVPVISSISVQPSSGPVRTWQYEYTGVTSTSATLSAVVLPDASRWTFNLQNLGGVSLSSEQLSGCTTRSLTPSGASYVSTVTAPSGLMGQFTVSPIWHARSYVETGCVQNPDFSYSEAIPPLFGTYALTRKEFSGPGVTPQAWTYAYAPAIGSAARDACAANNSCADTTWIDVTDPQGDRMRYTYSNRWGATEGKELVADSYQGSSTLLRSQRLIYAPFNQGPYPSNLGETMMDWRSNNAKQETWTPTKQRTMTQQGSVFTWAVSSFDPFARPLTVTRSSAPAP